MHRLRRAPSNRLMDLECALARGNAVDQQSTCWRDHHAQVGVKTDQVRPNEASARPHLAVSTLRAM
jgi:hypothetical protein